MSKAWMTRPLGMFTGADQTQNFRELGTIFPCRVIRRSLRPQRFVRGQTLPLPSSYEHEGKVHSSAKLLASTETAGLLLWQRGVLRYERYFLGLTRRTPWSLWSVTKSWVGTLIGVALTEGAIGSLDDMVTQYVPRLAESAYDGVTITQVLQMSSGARWDESYWNASSDIREAGRALAQGGSRGEVAASLKREHTPGSYHRYSSIDTHVLGMVLRSATGRPLCEYLREKLWLPLGAECDAYWAVEGDGREWAGAGLSASLRDTAKLGILYAQAGSWRGEQLLPKGWVSAATSANAPYLAPGVRNGSASSLGYGYQWWLPDATSGVFCAMGVYNQFVYVDPVRELVIAKFSANRSYALQGDPRYFREPEHFAWFRAVAARCE